MNWTSTTSTDGRRWRRPPPAGALAATVLMMMVVTGTGCRAVRGRKLIQDADELYKRGRYQDAVALFTEAEALVPDLPVLWLNKGYTCRQLVVPGANTPESRQAANCALGAFAKLKALRPEDPRGDSLYVQTLFDADDLPALEKLFTERAEKNPADLDAVRGLQQVYYKSGRWPAALEWSRKAAALRPRDAEAQYGVGTFVWQVLSAHGGGADMVAFDPRPKPVDPDDESAAHSPAPPAPPPTKIDDVTGDKRVALADEGIGYLEKALALRPRFPEAMTYLGLLERQKSFAYFATPVAWQAAVDRAQAWQGKAAGTRPGGGP